MSDLVKGDSEVKDGANETASSNDHARADVFGPQSQAGPADDAQAHDLKLPGLAITDHAVDVLADVVTEPKTASVEDLQRFDRRMLDRIDFSAQEILYDQFHTFTGPISETAPTFTREQLADLSKSVSPEEVIHFKKNGEFYVQFQQIEHVEEGTKDEFNKSNPNLLNRPLEAGDLVIQINDAGVSSTVAVAKEDVDTQLKRIGISGGYRLNKAELAISMDAVVLNEGARIIEADGRVIEAPAGTMILKQQDSKSPAQLISPERVLQSNSSAVAGEVKFNGPMGILDLVSENDKSLLEKTRLDLLSTQQAVEQSFVEKAGIALGAQGDAFDVARELEAVVNLRLANALGLPIERVTKDDLHTIDTKLNEVVSAAYRNGSIPVDTQLTHDIDQHSSGTSIRHSLVESAVRSIMNTPANTPSEIAAQKLDVAISREWHSLSGTPRTVDSLLKQATVEAWANDAGHTEAVGGEMGRSISADELSRTITNSLTSKEGLLELEKQLCKLHESGSPVQEALAQLVAEKSNLLLNQSTTEREQQAIVKQMRELESMRTRIAEGKTLDLATPIESKGVSAREVVYGAGTGAVILGVAAYNIFKNSGNSSRLAPRAK